ncbi:hypothetical protein GCM10027421_32290 [Microbacterium shaanxiense]
MIATIDAAPATAAIWSDLDDDLALIRGASTGQREAADLYLRRHWSALQRTARFIAGWRGDADDLLASAVTSTWSKWTIGTGPDRNVTGYIAQSMRNRLLDDMKSPRSKELSLEEDRVGFLPHGSDTYDVEAQMSRRIVADALATLPEDHRRLLIYVLIDGTPARDLTADFQRPAAWIHTTLYRSKKRLRSALLNVILSRACDSEDCRPRQERFSTVSGGMLLGQEDNKLLAELWHCGRCSQGLRDFEALAYPR